MEQPKFNIGQSVFFIEYISNYSFSYGAGVIDKIVLCKKDYNKGFNSDNITIRYSVKDVHQLPLYIETENIFSSLKEMEDLAMRQINALK